MPGTPPPYFKAGPLTIQLVALRAHAVDNDLTAAQMFLEEWLADSAKEYDMTLPEFLDLDDSKFLVDV